MKLKIYSFKNVKSTNDTALRFIKKNIINGIITSENQKKGRGQYGKSWISSKGNLFMSIFFPIENKINIKNGIHIKLITFQLVIETNIPAERLPIAVAENTTKSLNPCALNFSCS